MAQPWDPSFVLLSPWFTSLGLLEFYNGVRPTLTGRRHLGSDSVFAPDSLGDLGHILSPVRAWAGVSRLGMWDGAPGSWPSPLAVMVMVAIPWDSQARLPGLEPRQSLVTLVSVKQGW